MDLSNAINAIESVAGFTDVDTPVGEAWAVVLAQLKPAPVPVAVSERLPGAEDCDAEGRCWLHLPDMGTEPLWRLTDPALRSRYHSHWLPAHALPVPEVTP